MRRRFENGQSRSVGTAALLAASLGLIVLVVGQGFSSIGVVRALEDIGLGVIVAGALMGGVAFVAVRLAGWREPESESDDEDFEELVRDALDDLPDLLRNALAHVAVVISDGGRRAGAYGLYQGDGATRDNTHDRIVVFRDTLRRDFGHDGDLLRDQVTRTVRHELAHHVGFDELGVSRLDL